MWIVVTLLLFLSARGDIEQPERQLIREGGSTRGGVHTPPGAASKGQVVKEEARGDGCSLSSIYSRHGLFRSS